MLFSIRDDFLLCRDMESIAHAISSTHQEYRDNIMRVAFNINQNRLLGLEVVRAPDSSLIHGTALENIEEAIRAKEDRFQQMLQDKYENLDDERFCAIVKCLRCGSTDDITWDEKQTRGADEGATVFCVCTKCNNRWILK